MNQQLDNIVFKILTTCFSCKKPSSGQDRTKSRYTVGVHYMGSHIVHTFIVHRICSVLA
jgi:hypothetical protein